MKANVVFQSLYYVITGIWPMVSRRGFEAVTGRKTDFWLVRMVGWLVLVIGVVLGRANHKERLTPEIKLLSMGSALSLGGVSLWYAAKRRVSWIYAADTAAELVILYGWLRKPQRK